MDKQTPEELRSALAEKIPAIFDLSIRPGWCRTPKVADETLRKWHERYGSSFAEKARPVVLHRHYEEIPYDALRAIEAMEPLFWRYGWYTNIDDFKYMLAVYLRAMLLAPDKLDVAFNQWVSLLMYYVYLPEVLMRNVKQSRFGARHWSIPDIKALQENSKSLHDFTIEQRQFIAEFFREFSELYPNEDSSYYALPMSLVENFWDGIYLNE
ncbi:MAG: hypothetical protein H7A03_09970 [Pseudomonadales bacterium]|nr:hypothetical protein [Anaerolineae bacterium]MCP5303451.1 hypothetical protein [Pseudomonadales bacterium]